MSLIFPSGELLSTINFVLPPQLSSFSLVTIIGYLLVIVIGAYVIIQGFIKKKPLTYLFPILMIACLPLGLHWFYAQAEDSFKASIALGQPETTQVKNRACEIDGNQSFGNVFCNLPAFKQIIYRDVPIGSNLFLVEGGLRPFLEYQLTSDYYITDDAQAADYVVAYFGDSSINLDQEGNMYQSTVDESGQLSGRLLGKYELMSTVHDRALIFKKRS